MALTSKQILAYLQVKGVGTKSVFKIAEYARTNHLELSSPQEMYDLFARLLKEKVISRCKMEDPNALIDGLHAAQYIIDQSLAQDIHFTTYYSDDYPSKLRNIRDAKGDIDAPLVLWYKGDLSIAELPSVAIIGTREPTKEGVAAGRYFGKLLAEAGFNIVSGLAYGCDKTGHEGALSAVTGKTTAFLAHGLDTIYPPEHTELAKEIVHRGGLLMSEYPIGVHGNASFFIARDRLQSGLSDACIVIQTGRTGGTLHAVKATIVNHKPLFAVRFKDEIMTQEKVQGNVMLLEEGISIADSLAPQKAMALTSENVNDIIQQLKAEEVVNHTSEEPAKEQHSTPTQLELF